MGLTLWHLEAHQINCAVQQCPNAGTKDTPDFEMRMRAAFSSQIADGDLTWA
jgi:hypothetical protein